MTEIEKVKPFSLPYITENLIDLDLRHHYSQLIWFILCLDEAKVFKYLLPKAEFEKVKLFLKNFADGWSEGRPDQPYEII